MRSLIQTTGRMDPTALYEPILRYDTPPRLCVCIQIQELNISSRFVCRVLLFRASVSVLFPSFFA